MWLISLVGEQPLPVLLTALFLQPTHNILICTKFTEKVARRLEKIFPNSRVKKLEASPYDLNAVLNELEQNYPQGSPVCINLTGGTKIMSTAAVLLATKQNCSLAYLESEGHRNVLYQYQLQKNQPILEMKNEVGELLTIDTFLRSYLPGYRVEGFHVDPVTKFLDAGGQFEQTVYDALNNQGFELLAGVRPEGVADQIEIDLVIRLGNQVGIAEIKVGDKKGESIKRGLDQLAMAGAREYLGTYTQKFLIIARRYTGDRGKWLASTRGIEVIEIPNYQPGKSLTVADRDNLSKTIRNKLTPSRR